MSVQAILAQYAGKLHQLVGVMSPEEYAEFLELCEPTDEDFLRAEELARQGDCEQLLWLQWPNLRLDWFQIKTVNSVMSPLFTETAIKGCTKAGKGLSASLAVNLWFDLWEDGRVIITGPKYDHCLKVMFAEVSARRKEMRRPGKSDIRTECIYGSEKHQIIVSVPQTGESFSGAHSSHTLFVLDESSSVPAFMYENAKKQARHILALSNPRVLSGWFRDLFPAKNPDLTQTMVTSFGQRQLITVGGKDCINVRERRLEKPLGPLGGIQIRDRRFEMGEPIPREYFADVKLLIPNQIDYARYLDIMSHPDPLHQQVFGDGKFPTEDENKQVILYSWLERHRLAWNESLKKQVQAFALDVSLGKNKAEGRPIFAAGGTQGCYRLHEWEHVGNDSEASSVLLMEWGLTIAAQYGIDLCRGMNPICVDADVIGRGVADLFKSKGCWVIPFRGQKAADDPRAYGNARAEAWGELGRRLNPAEAWGTETWAIPDDQELFEELTTPEKLRKHNDPFQYHVTPKTRIESTPKEIKTLMESLKRSPDKADGLVYLWVAVRALSGFVNRAVTVDRSLVVDTQAIIAKAKAEFSDSPVIVPSVERVWERACAVGEFNAASDSRLVQSVIEHHWGKDN